VLVNNAGITSPGRKDLLDATEEGCDRVLDTNLKDPSFFPNWQLAKCWSCGKRVSWSEAR